MSAVINAPSSGAHRVLQPQPASAPASDAVRDEIRYRERQATAAIAGPVRTRPKAAPADTFARQKMREAEANLPDWDVDDEVYPDDDGVPPGDPDQTAPGDDEP